MYINEATNEIVAKSKNRQGKIKIEKHISDDPICQEKKTSGNKIIVMSDDLSSSTPAVLNYIGKDEDISSIGEELIPAPFGAC